MISSAEMDDAVSGQFASARKRLLTSISGVVDLLGGTFSSSFGNGYGGKPKEEKKGDKNSVYEKGGREARKGTRKAYL